MNTSTSIIVFFALFWGLILFGAIRGSSQKQIIQRAKAEGRYRLVEIAKRKFHAIRKSEIILRSKSGRGRAVLITVGQERVPDMEDGQIVMRHRWIKIRSITKNGVSDYQRWTRAQGWSYEGKQEIEYHIPVG